MSLVHYTSSSDEEEEDVHNATLIKPDAVGKRALGTDELTAAATTTTTNSGTKRYFIPALLHS